MQPTMLSAQEGEKGGGEVLELVTCFHANDGGALEGMQPWIR